MKAEGRNDPRCKSSYGLNHRCRQSIVVGHGLGRSVVPPSRKKGKGVYFGLKKFAVLTNSGIFDIDELLADYVMYTSTTLPKVIKSYHRNSSRVGGCQALIKFCTR
jgi:hypothetical protein